MKQKINIQTIFAVTQSEILTNLKKDLELSNILDIADTSDKLESKIPEIIRKSILDNSVFIHRNSARQLTGLYSITINKKHYEVVAQKDIRNPTEFGVAFLNRDFNNSKQDFDEKELKLTGCGQFETLKLFLPKRTAINYEFIRELVQTVFLTCYNWLEQKIYELSYENCIAASSLYLYIKAIFPNKEHWQNLWLYSVKDDNAFYLLDKEIIKIGIENTRTTAQKFDKNPLRLISEFLLVNMPLKDTNTKEVLKSNECIDFVLKKSPYVEERPLLLLAEMSVYQDDKFSLFPILNDNDGKKFLLAAFPTRFRKDIEPILEQNKKNLQDKFIDFNSRIVRVWQRLKRKKPNLEISGDIGYIFGRFFRGLGYGADQ